jgi:predicted deacylase
MKLIDDRSAANCRCLIVALCLLLSILVMAVAGCTLGQLSPTAQLQTTAQQQATPVTSPTSTIEIPPPLVTVATATAAQVTTPVASLTLGLIVSSTASPTPSLTSSLTPALASATPTLDPTPSLSPAATVSATLIPLTPTAISASTSIQHTTIGHSVEGRPIDVTQLGDGPRHVVFVGGMHGGYEWNSVLLAYELLDYLTGNPDLIPVEITLHVIPSANPDGQYRVTRQTGRFTAADVISDTLPGRFNANGVDLNRNWDCQWSPSAVWRNTPVSGGEAPFSEPENSALRDYLLAYSPEVVVFLHSAANGVFASGCPEPHQPSLELATVYGQAAGYPIYERFNAYPITGDAGDWLTAQDVPSFTVELRNHSATDWPQNREGIIALLNHIAAQAESG